MISSTQPHHRAQASLQALKSAAAIQASIGLRQLPAGRIKSKASRERVLIFCAVIALAPLADGADLGLAALNARSGIDLDLAPRAHPVGTLEPIARHLAGGLLIRRINVV